MRMDNLIIFPIKKSLHNEVLGKILSNNVIDFHTTAKPIKRIYQRETVNTKAINSTNRKQ
jgi:hypothetical protein